MRGPGVALLAILLTATGGCSHMTANTSQFYLAQDYLPLPPAARAPPLSLTPAVEASDSAVTLAAVEPTGDCVAGPVKRTRRNVSQRFTAQVLPGMMLRVTQTNYAATQTDHSIPFTSTWEWVVPTDAPADPTQTCADKSGAVPAWHREDLLRVRALLSGAQFLRGKPKTGVASTYFAEAMIAACRATNAAADGLTCAEKPFLDKFVAGLALNVRAQSAAELFDPHPLPQPHGPFEKEIPSSVIAATGAPDAGATGYGAWYASLTDFRYPSDLFLDGRQAERCRGPFTNTGKPGEMPHAQDAPVCKFAIASLEWSAPIPAARMPGDTLKGVAELSLLRAGDPLLLFQPQDYTEPLDTGNGEACDGDSACLLASRTMQGFTNIELLMPVTVSGARDWLPIGMSLDAFEKARGLKVVRISRSLDWLPTDLILADSKSSKAAKLAGGRRRVDLLPVDANSKSSGTSGLIIRSDKKDLLFAPGDIILARRP